MFRYVTAGEKTVEVPQAVVAEGPEAIEAYVKKAREPKRSKPKTTSQED